MGVTETRRWPFLQGVFPLDRAGLHRDLVAGMTLAALAVPSALGYTKIIGTPVVTGLYTLLIGMFLFALLGSSRHLVTGADSATAAVTSAGLAGLAVRESPEWLVLCSMVALLAGMMLLLARLLRLGFLASFLSRTVLTGFITGVGIQGAILELSGMLGLPHTGNQPLLRLVDIVAQLGRVNPYALAVSIAVFAVILAGQRISSRFPGALLAVIGAMWASYVWDLGHVLETIGTVPRGFPGFSLPLSDVVWAHFQKLIPIAFACAVVILSQSAATSRAYATRHDDAFDENVDMVGLAAANLGTGLFGAFVANGSPTQTEMVDGAGGHSQVAHLSACAVIACLLLFLTEPLAYLPTAVLSTIIFLVAVRMIDVGEMRRIAQVAPNEFRIAAVTAITVVVVGVEQAIILAMLLSMIDHVRRGYRAANAIIVADKRRKGWLTVPVGQAQQISPGMLAYQFSHSLYYANAAQFSEEVSALCKGRDGTPLQWFCVEAAAISDVDFTAAEMIAALAGELKRRGVRLVFANLSPQVLTQFERYGLFRHLEREAIFGSVHAAVRALEDATSKAADAHASEGNDSR